MALEVLRAAGVGRDLALIFDFVVAAAEDLGERAETAFDLAERRLVGIEAAMLYLGRVPHQGRLRAELGDG
ncbi:MAG: type II toxin-antitoxin system RelE/ParE family toxin, partial [Maritimibacter sp.]|nr:type II toxin-antitoxin system RelE/ParE family toxin [Maritimibacter sp.]